MCNVQTGSKADLGCVPVRVLATEFLLNFSKRRRRSNDQLLHSITYPPRLICQPPELALMPAPHQQAADVRLARHDHAHRRLQSGVELVRMVVAQKNLQCTALELRLHELGTVGVSLKRIGSHKLFFGFWQPRKAGLNKHTGKSCIHKIHKITSLEMI